MGTVRKSVVILDNEIARGFKHSGCTLVSISVRSLIGESFAVSWSFKGHFSADSMHHASATIIRGRSSTKEVEDGIRSERYRQWYDQECSALLKNYRLHIELVFLKRQTNEPISNFAPKRTVAGDDRNPSVQTGPKVNNKTKATRSWSTILLAW